jgi:cytosine/adenosine deaminase-related metal-dependent hydrolase
MNFSCRCPHAPFSPSVFNEHRAIASSVTIAYGTDAGVFPHSQNNKDFALLVSLGMRPIDVLRSATSNAAALIGLSDRGVLAPGKLADVVVFNGDPTRESTVRARRRTPDRDARSAAHSGLRSSALPRINGRKSGIGGSPRESSSSWNLSSVKALPTIFL